MQTDDVALLEQLCGRRHALHAFANGDGAAIQVGDNVHTKALRDAGDIVGHIAIGVQTDGLAFQFRTGLTREAAAHLHQQHTEYELGYRIGILARRIHHYDIVRCSCGQVDIIISGPGAYNDFQLLGGIEHCCVDFVAAHNERVDVRYGVQQLLAVGVFLQKEQFSSLALDNFTDSRDSHRSERFFCGY